MPNYNNVSLIGHLVRDPEPKPISNGFLVNCTVAVNSGYGEHKKAAFIDVVAFGKTAEYFVDKNPKQGDLVHVAGEIQQEKWDDKDGNKRNKLSVKAGMAGLCLLSKKGERTEQTESIDSVVNDTSDDVPF